MKCDLFESIYKPLCDSRYELKHHFCIFSIFDVVYILRLNVIIGALIVFDIIFVIVNKS